ncbi:MAG: VWA domain-containing protein [Acidobacteriota bacterium]
MKKRCVAVVIAAIFSISATALSSQDRPQEPIRISAELVQVDVLVTDKSGKPVRGLKREDFELYDNGKLQHITHFSYEESRFNKVEADDETPRSLPRAITASELRRVMAFVIDTLHLNSEHVLRVRKLLEDFIDKKMEPGDLALIIPTGGGSGLLQQFTSDQRILRRAIARLRPFVFGFSPTPYRTLEPSFGPTRLGFPSAPPIRGINTIDFLEEYDVRSTLRTMDNVIKSLARLPGRKLGVFISAGFRVNQTQTNSALSEMTARAARANVVFYSIDPRGLDPLGLEAGDNPGESAADFIESKRSDAIESQNSLNAIAADTGGKYFRNSNDIRRGLDQMLEENSEYYVLGFQPEEKKWDGKFHKLKVVVRGHEDYRVSTRKGYLARTEKPPGNRITDPKVAEMVEAVSSPLVRRDIDLVLTPFYRDDAKREPMLALLLHIDAARLNFRQVEGRYQTKLDMVGYLLDSSGRAIDRFSHGIHLNLQPDTYREALRRGLLSTRTVSLKPGLYQARIFIREADSGLIGTANDFVEIPKLKSDQLATSSIFTDARILNSPASEGDGATLSQRRFPRGSQFNYALVVYNARAKGGETQLEIKVRVLRGLKAVFEGPARPLQILDGSAPPQRIITGGIIQLGDLPSDDYTLEVTIIDKLQRKESRRVVRQEIDFSVE